MRDNPWGAVASRAGASGWLPLVTYNVFLFSDSLILALLWAVLSPHDCFWQILPHPLRSIPQCFFYNLGRREGCSEKWHTELIQSLTLISHALLSPMESVQRVSQASFCGIRSTDFIYVNLGWWSQYLGGPFENYKSIPSPLTLETWR